MNAKKHIIYSVIAVCSILTLIVFGRIPLKNGMKHFVRLYREGVL